MTHNTAHNSQISRKAILVIACLSLIITLLTLAWSFERGRLQYEIDYEDIITHIDGLKRWRALSEEGLRPFIFQYLASPPHAPLHSLMAASAFAFTGPRDWAPYALNGILVFFFLLLVWKQTWRFGLVPAAFAITMAAAVPVVYQSVHQFVPDFSRALLTLWAMIVFPRWSDQAFSKKAAQSGVLFGLALLAKPSFCPYTLAMGFPAWALAVAGGIRQGGSIRAAIPSILKTWPFFVGPALVAGPHYLVAWSNIFNYIFSNQFGESAYIWKSAQSLSHQIGYYWTGYSGKILLGEAVWVLLALVLIGFLIAWNRKSLEAIISNDFFRLVLFTFWAWILLAWNPLLNPFFGLVFQYGITLISSIALAWMVRLVCCYRISGLPLGLLIPISITASIIFLLFPLKEYKHEITNNSDPEIRKFAQSISNDVFEKLSEFRKFSDSGYTLFSSYGEVSSHRMDWLALKDRRDFRFYGVPHGPVENQIKLFIPDNTNHRVDFAFLSESSAFGVYNDLPNAHTSEQLLRWIQGSSDYQLVQKFDTPKDGFYYLYMMLPNYSAFEKVDGLSPKTSPLKMEGTPVVMNALQQAITLIYESPASGEATLELAVRCYPSESLLDLDVNGKRIAKIPVHPSNHFPESSIQIPLVQGTNKLEFYLMDGNGQPVDNPAFQFRRIRITPFGDKSPMNDILRKANSQKISF
jgi:hypothetical protein